MTHRKGLRIWAASAATLACAACSSDAATTVVALAPPVASEFHVTLGDITIDSGTATATADSPQLGSGNLSSAIKVDSTDPGPDNNCNTVDENGTFTFPAGNITYRSWHRDCNFGGPRIQTVFAITGGTGSYVGATGWGTEHDGSDSLVYDGTITYAAAT